jgi:hypothetical protein
VGDFTVADLKWVTSDLDIAYWKLPKVADDFGWWCLGHNFDVVATILTMASLSWQKGFDAGCIISSFSDETLAKFDPDAYAEYFKSVQFGQASSD